MFVTLATDMAIKRLEYRQNLIMTLIAHITLSMVTQRVVENETYIVNKDGKVISKWVMP